MGVVNRRAKQRALAIGVIDGREHGEPLTELKELLRTAGVATVGVATQQRPKPDPDRYFGRGRIDEVKAEVKAIDANLVACDDELLPRQERNLETALGVPVVDRTAVILDIFADHANSAEGKLQVELAQLEYNMARMRGLWTHLERLGGGIGTRGPGESQIETDRRLARDRISALRRRLAETEQEPRRDARPARALLDPQRRPRRLHQRRQVDPAERADRRRGRGRRPPLRDARPDHAELRALRPRLPADRHGRLHREAAPPTGRGVQGDARGDHPGRPDRARGRRLRDGRAADHRHARGRRGAGGDRGGGEAAPPRPQQGRSAERRRAPRGRTRPPGRGAGLGARR